jgi:hypothetical protein
MEVIKTIISQIAKPIPVENIALLESIRKFKGVLKSKTGYIPQKNEFYEQSPWKCSKKKNNS